MSRQSLTDKRKQAASSGGEQSWAAKAAGSVSGLFSKTKATAQGYKGMDGSIQPDRSSSGHIVGQSSRLGAGGTGTTTYGTFKLY